MTLGQRYILRPAFIGDSYTVLQDLREEDRIEWLASVAGGVELNLWDSIIGSAEAYTVAGAEDDVAHIIFGVHTGGEEPATWLLATNEGQQQAAWIMYAVRDFYMEFFKRWPKTVCYSHPGNPVHHRWLEYLGYVQVRRLPWGPYRAEFIEFRKEG